MPNTALSIYAPSKRGPSQFCCSFFCAPTKSTDSKNIHAYSVYFSPGCRKLCCKFTIQYPLDSTIYFCECQKLSNSDPQCLLQKLIHSFLWDSMRWPSPLPSVHPLLPKSLPFSSPTTTISYHSPHWQRNFHLEIFSTRRFPVHVYQIQKHGLSIFFEYQKL